MSRDRARPDPERSDPRDSDPERAERSRRTLRDAVLLTFVGAALIGGLLHYGVLVDGSSAEDRPAATARAKPTPTPTWTPTATRVGTPVASDAASATTTDVQVAPPATSVSCWNGQPADRVNACSLPSGQAGLHWVFPSLDSAAGVSCQPAPAPAGDYPVVVGLTCFARIDGQPVRITYEQLASRGQAEQAIDKTYAGGDSYDFPGARGGRCTWFDPTGTPSQVTGYYRGFPYAVSVISPSKQITKQAWASLVTMRESGDIRGVRA